jgi:CBS-domain-containing membrane protein
MPKCMKHWNNGWELLLSIVVAAIAATVLFASPATPITGVVAILFAASAGNAVILVVMALVYALWKTITWPKDSDATSVVN